MDDAADYIIQGSSHGSAPGAEKQLPGDRSNDPIHRQAVFFLVSADGLVRERTEDAIRDTDFSVAQFEQLLLQSQMTISEITYEVGFSDPRYFSKQFKAEFNILPSKYKENLGI